MIGKLKCLHFHCFYSTYLNTKVNLSLFEEVGLFCGIPSSIGVTGPRRNASASLDGLCRRNAHRPLTLLALPSLLLSYLRLNKRRKNPHRICNRRDKRAGALRRCRWGGSTRPPARNAGWRGGRSTDKGESDKAVPKHKKYEIILRCETHRP